MRRVIHPSEVRPPIGGRWHAFGQGPGTVGEFDLDALVPRCVEPFAQLRAPPIAHQRLIVLAQIIVRNHRAVEAAVDIGAMVLQVFEQVHVGLQTQLGEQLHRRGVEQLREPCMEGANFDGSAGQQQALVQPGEHRRQLVRLGRAEAARLQLSRSACVVARRRAELAQPFVEPRTHLAGG